MRSMSRQWMRHAGNQQKYGELTWVVGSKAERPGISVAEFARRGRRSKDLITGGRRVASMVTGYRAASPPKFVRRAQRLPTESAF